MKRGHDKFIMDEVSRLNLSKQDNIKMNACRLYLQITHISDITSTDGKEQSCYIFNRSQT